MKSYFRGSPETPLTVEKKKCSANAEAIRQVTSAPNLDGLAKKQVANLEDCDVENEENQVPKLRYVKSDVGRKRKLSSQI